MSRDQSNKMCRNKGDYLQYHMKVMLRSKHVFTEIGIMCVLA